MQQLLGLATDLVIAKHDGHKAEAEYACSGKIHEEAKAHEGWIGHTNIKRVGENRSTSVKKKAL